MPGSRSKPKSSPVCTRCQTSSSAPRPLDVRDPSTWPVVLDADDVAAVLRRPRREVQRLARVGKVPGAFRSGRYWRFRTAPLRLWLQGRDR